MKKILLMLVVISILAACKKDNSENMLELGAVLSLAAPVNVTLPEATERPAGDVVTITAGGVTFQLAYVPNTTFISGLADNGDRNGDGDNADAFDEPDGSTVTGAYEIGNTEVTYELWSTVYDWAINNGYSFSNVGKMGDGNGDTNQHPVTLINWRDALVWTNALTEYYNSQNGTSIAVVYTSDSSYSTPIRSSSDGTLGASVDLTQGSFDNPYVNPDAKGFRLPTRNEWELSARYKADNNSDGDIMDEGEYYPGNYASGAVADTANKTETDLVAVNSNNSGGSTAAVKSKAANALGLYDICGNVWEWNFDWHPNDPDASRLVLGASWESFLAEGLQVGDISNKVFPYWEYSSVGFRIARNP